MRNLISFFAFPIVIGTILFFASCTKDALTIPETNAGGTIAERSTTIQLPVERVGSVEASGEYIVDFASSDDFTNVILEPTQYLKYEDASGNISTLTFSVNSFTGSIGALNAVFAIGSNDLSGLTLTEVQEIIIEDNIIQ